MIDLTEEEKEFIERVKPLVKKFLETSREVGSYVLSENGNIYHGVPFEHIRCIHGEENAIGTMLTEEGKTAKFKLILIVGSPTETIMPCGICREAMRRYGVENVSVLCSNQEFTKIEKFRVSEIYPYPYEESECNFGGLVYGKNSEEL
ncbi:MAG: cytidine deaminase family protein [Candidatus Thorarchaeota archaeon]|jgi:cytidine deaminase